MLDLSVSEPDRAVDPDGGLAGIGDDHQSRGAELVDSIPGSVKDQRSGQALAAGVRVGPDVLITGDPGPAGKHAQLSCQLTIHERAEPGSVTGLGESAPGGVSGFGKCTAGRRAVLRIAHRPQLGRLLPAITS